MPSNNIGVFIGSSSASDARGIVGRLTEALESFLADDKTKRYKVSAWTDGFPVGTSVEAAFRELLGSNDFFVLLLTPDAESRRLTGNVTKMVCNENVLFEAGAAYGRYGLSRLLLVRDPTVEIISELQGIITIELNSKAENLNAHIDRVARTIDDHIRRVARTERDGRLRWLSLMKCKPALQQDVVNWLKAFERQAAAQWKVEYERCGVLWGPPDDFLLFSVPGVDQFIGFITALRTRMGESLIQVDSRLVFPNKYWNKAAYDAANKCMQLVLLACAPQFVENAYDALVSAAKDDGTRKTTGVEIVTVGVATGDADLFFITAAERETVHRDFVETYLHKKILQHGWLTHNTTSMVIT